MKAVLLALLLAACAAERPITAAELPKVRPGQWTFTGEAKGVPSGGRVCLAGFAGAIGRSYKGCDGFRYARKGGAVIVRNRCVNPDGVQVATEMTFKGDYAAAFSMDDHIVITRTPLPVPPTTVHIRYRYAGPLCAPPTS